MPAHNIVAGQRVNPVKADRARELRRQMTSEETLLWQRLRRNQLGGLHFRGQQVIEGFIVDFYCPAVGLIVEVDGGIHEGQREYDAERDRVLQARGLHIIRFSNARVRQELAAVLAEMGAVCGPNPPPPFPIREGGDME